MPTCQPLQFCFVWGEHRQAAQQLGAEGVTGPSCVQHHWDARSMGHLQTSDGGGARTREVSSDRRRGHGPPAAKGSAAAAAAAPAEAAAAAAKRRERSTHSVASNPTLAGPRSLVPLPLTVGFFAPPTRLAAASGSTHLRQLQIDSLWDLPLQQHRPRRREGRALLPPQAPGGGVGAAVDDDAVVP